MEHRPAPAPTPVELLAQWRQRAQLLQQFGDANAARLWTLAATELERALDVVADQTLSLTEAARLSGYTADHLSYLIRTKKLPNAGRRNAPRVRRGDLPMKPEGGAGRPLRRRLPDIHPHRRS